MTGEPMSGWHEGTVEAEMTMQQSPQPVQQPRPRQRQRQRQTTRKQQTMGAAMREEGEASRFAAEWRQDVMQQFRDQGEINQKVSMSLVDLTSTVATLKTVVEDMKKAPGDVRSSFGTYGGCIGQLVFAVFSGVGALTGISGTVIAIIALIHR